MMMTPLGVMMMIDLPGVTTLPPAKIAGVEQANKTEAETKQETVMDGSKDSKPKQISTQTWKLKHGSKAYSWIPNHHYSLDYPI
jgi:hypothetical protein